MNWSDFWDGLFKFLPYLITAGISYYAIRHTGKMKKLELKDAERGRVFQIQNKITDKSIESLMKAHYSLQQQISFAHAIVYDNGDFDEKIIEDIQNAHAFVKSHAVYFPLEIRENLRNASFKMLHIIKLKDHIEDKIKISMFSDALNVMEETKRALESFIDKFNLLNHKF